MVLTLDEQRYLDIALKFPPKDLTTLIKIKEKLNKAQARKIKSFSDYLNLGGELTAGKHSAFLLLDTFKISSVIYYKGDGFTLLTDSAYDNLQKFICKNLNWFKEVGAIPAVLEENEIDANTGFHISLKTESEFAIFNMLTKDN